MQVDQTMFNYIAGSKVKYTRRSLIMSKLNINWLTVKWQDLKKPLFSALAARYGYYSCIFAKRNC